MGMMSDRRRSSSAAVNPAGPAPAMTAIFCGLAVEGIRSNLAAVIQVPVLPCSGVDLTNPPKADVHGRNYESKLRVCTNLGQIFGGERSGRGIGLQSARG